MFLVVLESENKEQSNRPPTCELAGKGGGRAGALPLAHSNII